MSLAPVVAATTLCATTVFLNEPFFREIRVLYHMKLLETGYSYRQLFLEHPDVQAPGLYYLLLLLRNFGLNGSTCTRLVFIAGLLGSALMLSWHLRDRPSQGAPSVAALCILAIGSAHLNLNSKTESCVVLFLLSTQLTFLHRYHTRGGFRYLALSYLALSLAGLFKAHLPFVIYSGVVLAAWVTGKEGSISTFKGKISRSAIGAAAAFVLSLSVSWAVLRDAMSPAIYNAALRSSPSLYYPVSWFIKPLDSHRSLLLDIPTQHWWETLFSAVLCSLSQSAQLFYFAFPFSLLVPVAMITAFRLGDFSDKRGNATLWLFGGLSMFTLLSNNGEFHFMFFLLPPAVILVANEVGKENDAPGLPLQVRVMGTGLVAGGVVTTIAAVAPLFMQGVVMKTAVLMTDVEPQHPDIFVAALDTALGVVYFCTGLAMLTRSYRWHVTLRSVVTIVALAICIKSAAIVLHTHRISAIRVFFNAVAATAQNETVVFGQGVHAGYSLFLDGIPVATNSGGTGPNQWTVLDAQLRERWKSRCAAPVLSSGVFPSTGKAFLLARCNPDNAP